MFLELRSFIRATGGYLFRTGTSLKIDFSPPTQFRFSKKLPDFKCLGLPTARSLQGPASKSSTAPSPCGSSNLRKAPARHLTTPPRFSKTEIASTQFLKFPEYQKKRFSKLITVFKCLPSCIYKHEPKLPPQSGRTSREAAT